MGCPEDSQHLPLETSSSCLQAPAPTSLSLTSTWTHGATPELKGRCHHEEMLLVLQVSVL